MSEPTIVFESPADQAGFVQMPNVVLMDETLSVTARLLYAMLLHYARQAGSCFPGQALLGQKLRLSDRRVQPYMRELEESMLVTTQRRGLGKTNLYVILALGLRAKRIAERGSISPDRTPASSPADRTPASSQSGRQLPIEVDAVVNKTQKGESARGLRVGGRFVNGEAWALTAALLTEFNRAAGRKLRLLTSAGQPSEAAKRIYGRVRAYPDLTFAEHVGIIERTLGSCWWGSDPPSIGVVYGPAVFEENITRPGTLAVAGRTVDPARAARKTRDRAARERVVAARRGHS